MQRDEVSDRKVDPYHLVFRDGQFYLIGHSHERDEVRVFRLSRIRGKVSYATKAEHDFAPPEDFDRRDYASRADWQMGEIEGPAKVFLRERIAWLVERDFGGYGDAAQGDQAGRRRAAAARSSRPSTPRPRQLISWVLGWRENATLLEPEDLAARGRRAPGAAARAPQRRVRRSRRRSAGRSPRATARPRVASNGRSESVIRPERFARLVTLAGLLIGAAREEARPAGRPRCSTSSTSACEELREDIDVLNVVNFGGGTYVLYAEIDGDEIEVDPDTYGDNFARPARLLPLEAKALVAAIDLFGDHLPQAGLQTAREKIVEALGHDPSQEGLEIAPGRDDSEVVRTVNDAIERAPGARAPLLQGERGRVRQARGRALPAGQAARRAGTSAATTSAATTPATSASTG